MAGQKSNGSQQGGGFNFSGTQNTGQEPYLREFGQGYNFLSGKLANTQAPTLSFFKPKNVVQDWGGFSRNFDPVVRNAMAQGRQAIGNQTSAANTSLANRLSVSGTGDNSALMAALQRRSQFGTAGAQNALYGQGLEQQRGYDIAGANILQNQNAQKLQQQGQFLDASNAQNASNIQNYLAGLSGIQTGGGLLGQTLQGANIAGGQASGGLTGFDQASAGKAKKTFF